MECNPFAFSDTFNSSGSSRSCHFFFYSPNRRVHLRTELNWADVEEYTTNFETEFIPAMDGKCGDEFCFLFFSILNAQPKTFMYMCGVECIQISLAVCHITLLLYKPCRACTVADKLIHIIHILITLPAPNSLCSLTAEKRNWKLIS